jgi:predicted metal-dependent RNase
MAAAAPEEPVDPADELMFLCLGGGNEVGRSCHIIQYKGKTVMVRSPVLTFSPPNTGSSKLVLFR